MVSWAVLVWVINGQLLILIDRILSVLLHFLKIELPFFIIGDVVGKHKGKRRKR